METDGREAGQALYTSSQGHTKCPCDPTCRFTLHGGQGFEGTNILGSLVVPEPVAVRCDRKNAGTVQDLFVLGAEAPSRVPKHPHHCNSGKGLGGIIPNMLLECELVVKEETRVTPKLLGFQGGLIREQSKTEVYRAVPPGAGPSEVKQLVLVMLHDQAHHCENIMHNHVHMP
jgi:hypothetical protein